MRKTSCLLAVLAAGLLLGGKEAAFAEGTPVPRAVATPAPIKAVATPPAAQPTTAPAVIGSVTPAPTVAPRPTGAHVNPTPITVPLVTPVVRKAPTPTGGAVSPTPAPIRAVATPPAAQPTKVPAAPGSVTSAPTVAPKPSPIPKPSPAPTAGAPVPVTPVPVSPHPTHPAGTPTLPPALPTPLPEGTLSPTPLAVPTAPQPVPTRPPVAPSPAVSGGSAPAGQAETRESLLITVAELKANPSKYFIVDCRPLVLYQKGHIPGAVNVDWTHLASMSGRAGDPGWGDVLDKDRLARKLSSLGFGTGKPIVFYADQGGWGQDGWAVWIARMMGDPTARMLDGGISAWQAAGGVLYRNPVVPKPGKVVIKRIDKESWNVTTQQLAEGIGRIKLIDCRTAMEYNGARYFQERRGGHIPTAVNIPFDTFYQADGTIKDAARIAEALAVYGIRPGDEVVVYDTAGVRSAHMTLLLRMSGFPNARNYDGGFQEWAGTKELEVVGGK